VGKIYIRIESEDEADLQGLHDRLVEVGVSVLVKISTKPWGLRDFTVEDLDGVSAILLFVMI
jgi:uncharacterized glyoxalase superfamily protein PhnB